jgi:hypothetical protein
MAYKVFSNGDALTGGELNTFLMNQSVISFASEAARNAALTAPLEGQLVWLEDSNKYVYYTGSAWVDLIAPAGSGNALINGAFDIWQRGTSIANTGATAYGADRWALGAGALSNTTISRQTAVTVGARYGMRWGRNSGVTSATKHVMSQPLETFNSLQFAGKTATLSFNALRGANAPTSLKAVIYYGTGTDQTAGDLFGGWTGGTQAVATVLTIGTTVASYSISGAIPTTATQVAVFFEYDSTGTAGAAEWFQVENVQLEASSTATPFRRNANTIQGELAACQRYFMRVNSQAASGSPAGVGGYYNSTTFLIHYPFKVTMRTSPALTVNNAASWSVFSNGSSRAASAISLDIVNSDIASLAITTSSATSGQTGQFQTNNANASLDFSAEL